MEKKTYFKPGKFFIFCTILLMIYLLGVAYINFHEYNHKLIFERYNMKAISSIDYLTLSGKTITNGYNCNDFCKLDNALNDIFGYYLVIFIFNSWALFLTYLAYRRIYGKEK